MIHVEAFQAPCCGGPAGQWNEVRLASLMRDVRQQLGDHVKITIHTLTFGDPASLEAVSRLAGYLRNSNLDQLADAGVFGILGALPIISLNGAVRFVKAVPNEAKLLEAIQEIRSSVASPAS